jgi:hypothetical protein
MNRARHIVSFRGRACTGGTSSLERHRLHRVYTGGTSSLERQRLHHACTRETSSLERHRLHHACTRGTSSLALGAIAASTGGTALGVPAVRRAIKPPPLGHNGDGGSSMPLLGHTDDGGLKTSKQRRTSGGVPTIVENAVARLFVTWEKKGKGGIRKIAQASRHGRDSAKFPPTISRYGCPRFALCICAPPSAPPDIF